ncbi:phosphodiester glycosidase family protein [Streptomyces sp. NPDC019224]|uniref:phosphodiester glycosidase family protein n=1 Tax=Streptomyces sp. NPDC019224 TaxID=3154484 RepID=UPI0033E5B9D1
MNGRRAARTPALLLALLTAACTAQTGAGPDTRDARALRPSAGSSQSAEDLPDGITFRQSVRRLADGSPVRVSVLAVAPDAPVDVRTGHGGAVATTDTVLGLARRAHAVAAVNGTYFDTDSTRYKGDPLGLYVSDGALLSEATNGRTALILPGRGERPRITELRSATYVTSSDGARAVVDGTDRVPGRIVGCGGVGGDRRTDTGARTGDPLPGRVCFDPDELVDFPAQWGVPTPGAERHSVEAVLDATGTVTAVRSPSGGTVPAGGRSLVGIGSAAGWLREHARTGRALTVESHVTDPDGRAVDTSGASIVGAGPALVRHGRTWINAAANGVSRAAVSSRSPRTVAGIRPDGTLLLVVFDGRRPGVSEGVTLTEAAGILVSLGAEDAINLDGGGSSTMVVRDKVRNSPSDPGDTDEERQRKVSNALVVVPRRIAP